jgi:hypothetical protein
MRCFVMQFIKVRGCIAGENVLPVHAAVHPP